MDNLLSIPSTQLTPEQLGELLEMMSTNSVAFNAHELSRLIAKVYDAIFSMRNELAYKTLADQRWCLPDPKMFAEARNPEALAQLLRLWQHAFHPLEMSLGVSETLMTPPDLRLNTRTTERVVEKYGSKDATSLLDIVMQDKIKRSTKVKVDPNRSR